MCLQVAQFAGRCYVLSGVLQQALTGLSDAKVKVKVALSSHYLLTPLLKMTWGSLQDFLASSPDLLSLAQDAMCPPAARGTPCALPALILAVYRAHSTEPGTCQVLQAQTAAAEVSHAHLCQPSTQTRCMLTNLHPWCRQAAGWERRLAFWLVRSFLPWCSSL